MNLKSDTKNIHAKINIRSYYRKSCIDRFKKGLNLNCPNVRKEQLFKTNHVRKQQTFLSKF